VFHLLVVDLVVVKLEMVVLEALAEAVKVIKAWSVVLVLLVKVMLEATVQVVVMVVMVQEAAEEVLVEAVPTLFQRTKAATVDQESLHQ
jgi:hypothetical protein